MSIDIDQHIARLLADREGIEQFLVRHHGWARLRAARNSGVEASELHRLTVEAESDLGAHPLLVAWRALTNAIAAFEEVKAETAVPPPRNATASDTAAVFVASITEPAASAPDADVSAPEPPRAEPQPVPSSAAATPPTLQQIELLALSRGAFVTRTAVLHAAPPGAARAARPTDDAPHTEDDLTRIRGIDRKLADDMKARGIHTFDEIAAFSMADVRTLAAALGLGRRISAENWIEQAAVLASRQAKLRRSASPPPSERTKLLVVNEAAPGLDAASPTPADVAAVQLPPDASPAVSPVAAAPAATLPAALPAVGLLIHAAAARIAASAAMPAMPAAQFDDGRTDQPASIDAGPEPEPAVRDEIALADAGTDLPLDDGEQAGAPDHVLIASTALVEHVETRAPQPTPATAIEETSTEPHAAGPVQPAEAAEPEPATTPSTIAGGADAIDIAAPAPEPLDTLAELAAPLAIAPIEPVPPPDDLTAIRAITTDLAAALAALGVTRYDQIAAWSAADVAALKLALGQRGARLHVDGWIEQAAALARGSATAYAVRHRSGAVPMLAARPLAAPQRDPAFAMWLALKTSALPIPHPPTADAAPAAPPKPVATPDPIEPAIEPITVSEPSVAVDTSALDAAAPATTSIGEDTATDLTEPTVPAELAGPGSSTADTATITPPVQVLPPPIPVTAPPSGEPSPVPQPALPDEPAGSAHHLKSISERMRAIERDIAALEIVPLSPPQSRRMLVAKPAPAAAADGDPDEVPTEIVFPRRDAAHDEAADELARIVGTFDEAHVVIVRRTAIDIGLDPLPAARSSEIAAPAEAEFDKSEYAAYRQRIEEAVVEIVAPGGRPAAADGSDKGAATGDDAADPKTPVDRFLKALTGS